MQRVGRDHVEISTSVLKSGLDDGDVILAPTREDVRIAFKAVAGGPPILFGASAGAAWRAASAMLPGRNGESRRPELRFGWLGASIVLLMISIIVSLLLVDASVGVKGAAFVAALSGATLVVVRLTALSLHVHLQDMAIETKVDSEVERIPKADSSEDAETARAPSPDKE